LNVAHKTGHINENKREKKRNSVIWNLFECRKVFLEVSKYKLCNSKIQSQCMPFKKKLNGNYLFGRHFIVWE